MTTDTGEQDDAGIGPEDRGPTWYANAVRAAEGGVCEFDREHRITDATTGFLNLVGYEREALLGEHVSRLIDDAEALAAAAERLRGEDSGVVQSLSLPLRTATGDAIPCELRLRNLSRDGEVDRTVGVVRDRTERRRLETERELLSALLESVVAADSVEEALSAALADVCEVTVWDHGEGWLPTERGFELRASTGAHVESSADASAELDGSGPVGHAIESGDPERLDDSDAGELPAGTPRTTPDAGPDDRQAPAREAVETGEPRFVPDARGGDDYEALARDAREWGYRSMASVPIAYEGVRYGVLNVYTARADAFDARERDVLTRLGEVVGHAITTIERKEPLVPDQVVEVNVRSTDLARPFAEAATAAGGDVDAVSLQQTIPDDDGDLLLYHAVDGIDPDAFAETLSGFELVDEVREIQRSGDAVRLEARVSPRELTSTLAARGGRVESLTVDGSGAEVTVELPREADVRSVVDAVREAYPDAELVSRTTTDSEDVSPREFRSRLQRKLTDRQRTALEAALAAGFFDWPRGSTGEEVAESLGVSSATLHQHLRIGERKLLEAFFEGPAEE